MVDKIQSLLGPDGSPSDRDVDIVGATRSAPASIAPWPAPGGQCGPLDKAWLNSVLPLIVYPTLTPEEDADARYEAEISAALARKKPGRPPDTQGLQRPAYRALALECLENNPGNRKRAKDEFIPRATAQFNVTDTYARKLWYELLKDIFPDR